MVKFFFTLFSKCRIDVIDSYKTEAIIYFHWPFCKNICTFCNFNKYKKSELKFGPGFDDKMDSSLQRETQTILELSGITKIKSIFFGGGTPSLAPIETITKLINLVKNSAEVDELTQITIECNPSSSMGTPEILQDYLKSGVNRLSVGLQSTKDIALKKLGRDHSATEGLLLLKDAHNIFGPKAVSVDLLFRKPDDTVESWKDELTEVLSYNPSHISLYELTPEKSTHLFKQLKSGEVVLPNESETASMYLTAVEYLEQNGLQRYEASNFVSVASTSSKSFHNISYWNGTQYIGIGPGAHSRFYPLNTSLRESRVQCLNPKLWHQTVERYGHGTQVRKQQSQHEVLSELLATSLRTIVGVQPERWNIFQPKYSLMDVFGPAQTVQNLCRNKILLWGVNGNLHATKTGLNVIDSVLPVLLNVLTNFHKDNSIGM